MPKNISKIYQRSAFMILAIIISGLLNVCLFSWQAKAAPMPMPKINFAYANSDTCAAQPLPEPLQNINYPAAPMPQCCLAQNRNFDAVVNAANDKTVPTFADQTVSAPNNLTAENSFTYNTSQTIFPPPAESAIISTVIRE